MGTVLGDGTLNATGGPTERRVSVVDRARPTDVLRPDEIRTAVGAHFDAFRKAVRPRKNWTDASVTVTTPEGRWERTWQRSESGREVLDYERIIDHGRERYSLVLDDKPRITMLPYAGLSSDIVDHGINTRGLLQRIDEIAAIIKTAEQDEQDAELTPGGEPNPEFEVPI